MANKIQVIFDLNNFENLIILILRKFYNKLEKLEFNFLKFTGGFEFLKKIIERFLMPLVSFKASNFLNSDRGKLEYTQWIIKDVVSYFAGKNSS